MYSGFSCVGSGSPRVLSSSFSSALKLRFLPPNMAALFGPAIGARNSRQEDFGYTALRALAQHKIIKTCILPIPLILLYLLSGGRLTGPTMATPANLPSGKAGCTALPTNLPTKPTPASRDAKYVQRGPLVHITHNIQLTSSNKQSTNTLHKSGLHGISSGRTKSETTQNIHINI